MNNKSKQQTRRASSRQGSNKSKHQTSSTHNKSRSIGSREQRRWERARMGCEAGRGSKEAAERRSSKSARLLAMCASLPV